MPLHAFASCLRGCTALGIGTLTAAVIAACSAPSAAPDHDAASTSPPQHVTYHHDVAPLLAAHCVSCHTEGGIAGFGLGSYAEAAAVAPSIKSVTASRHMPPFAVDNSGTCQTYRDARWLTDEQIAVLGAWADEGAPEGPPESTEPESPHAAQLDDATMTLDVGEAYEPVATGIDEYRCFVLDPHVTTDQFLVGYQPLPGETRIVHHLGILEIEGQSAIDQANAADAADPGPGFECQDLSQVTVSKALGASGPGSPVFRFPEGTGIKLAAGSRVLLQIHYSVPAGRFSDRTRVRMKLAPSVAHEGSITAIAATNFTLPAGQERATTTASYPMILFPARARIYGVAPHMHQLGRTMRIEVAHNNAHTCFTEVPSWNYHWQEFYTYNTPLTINWGDWVSITCEFDTRSSTQPVVYGPYASNEMCQAFFFMVPE